MNSNMLGEDSRTAASKKKFECGPRRICFPMQALEIVVRCVFFIKKTAGEMVGASQPSFVTFVLFRYSESL